MQVTLGIDAINGDTILKGKKEIPPATRIVNAVKRLLVEDKEVDFILAGNKKEIGSELKDQPRVEIINSDSLKPGEGHKKHSSLNVLTNMAYLGSIEGFFTIADTHNVCKESVRMGRLEGLGKGSYPALLAHFPSLKGKFIIADVGATTEQVLENTYNHGVMAAAYAKYTLKIPRPKLGILTIGTEKHKGSKFVKSLDEIFTRMEERFGDFLDYQGKIEIGDGFSGKVDIVLTDGHTGNITLKSVEAAVNLLTHFIKEEASNLSIPYKLSLALGYPGIRKLKSRVSRKIDPRVYNGAIAIGFNGAVFKGRGNSDEKAIFYGMKRAVDYIRKDINSKVESALEKYKLPR